MGRPITSNTQRAKQRREQMRRAREAMKERPVKFNPQPLAQVVSTWRPQ
jgi:hypothetical protein